MAGPVDDFSHLHSFFSVECFESIIREEDGSGVAFFLYFTYMRSIVFHDLNHFILRF